MTLTDQQWSHEAHQLWTQDLKSQAIDRLLSELNAVANAKPKGLMMQFSYYLFLLNDYAAAVQVLDDAHNCYPDDAQVAANLVVLLSKTQQYKRAVEASEYALRLDAKSYAVYDALAKCYQRLGQYRNAVKAGDQSLLLKDQLVIQVDERWCLPSKSATEFTAEKKRVIAFSLWGNSERYINGAIRNALLAHDLYPDWEVWVYHDETVSSQLLALLASLGVQLILQASNQPDKQKLCWRFQVADHPQVGYFLVRDIDSVFSVRERMAVQEWLGSNKWFHTINDWWTHTDLMLAGMWGGVAGVLPNVWQSALNYQPAALTTPNVDQWFLRDCIWPYVKQSCYIHDRYFRQDQAHPIPGPEPIENQHIGSCEFTQLGQRQRELIRPWLTQLERNN